MQFGVEVCTTDLFVSLGTFLLCPSQGISAVHKRFFQNIYNFYSVLMMQAFYFKYCCLGDQPILICRQFNLSILYPLKGI